MANGNVKMAEFWRLIRADDAEGIGELLRDEPKAEWFAKRSMGATALHVACRSGCVNAIRYLVSNGADPNVARSSDAATPLILACKYGQIAAVRCLLEVAAGRLDIELGMKYGVTPLHSASKAGHARIVALLLDAGSEVNSRMTHGATPLYLTAENNHLKCLQLLLRRGADPDLAMSNSCTPLFIAAQNGHNGAVALLVEHAQATGRKLKLDSALFIATQQGHSAVTRALLGCGASPDARNTAGVSVLCVCVLRNRLDEFDELVRLGADLNWQLPNDGSSALSLAVQKDRTAMAKRLLAQPGVDPTIPLRDGATPLHIACFFGRTHMIDLLMAAGADVNARRRDGITPLYFALQNKHFEAARRLLELDTAGVIDCASECDGCYPLYLAASQPGVELVEALVARGADVNARLADGATALLLACNLGHKEVAVALLKAGADAHLELTATGATPLHVAVQAGHADVVRMLLTAPVVQPPLDVDAPLQSGNTALHLAVSNRHGRCVEVLLRQGASANVVDSDECYPLYVAAHQGDRDTVSLLLRHGADPDRGSKLDGASPLHICAHAEDSSTRCTIARLLINSGANHDAVMSDGASPLYVACYEGAVRLMRLLLDFGVNPDGARIGGPAPIHVACEKRQLEPLKMLLEYGANPDLRLECGAPPLFICAENGFMEGAELLLEYGAKVDLARRDGTTPLWAAAHQGHDNVVVQLVSRGADVNVRGGANKETVLEVARRRKHAVVAQLLQLAGSEKYRSSVFHLLSLLRSTAQRAVSAENESEVLREQLEASLRTQNEVQVVALARPHEFEVLKWIAGNNVEAVYHVQMKQNGVKYTMKVVFDFEGAQRKKDSMFFQELCIHRIMTPNRHLYCPLTHFVANPASLGIPCLPRFVLDNEESSSSLFLIAPMYAMNLSIALKEDFTERPLRLSIALRWARELCVAVDHLYAHNVCINAMTVSDVLLDVPSDKTVDEGSLVLAGIDRAVTYEDDDMQSVHTRTCFGVGCILFELLHPSHVHPLAVVDEEFSLGLLEDALRDCPASAQCKEMVVSLLVPSPDGDALFDHRAGMRPYIVVLDAEIESQAQA